MAKRFLNKLVDDKLDLQADPEDPYEKMSFDEIFDLIFPFKHREDNDAFEREILKDFIILLHQKEFVDDHQMKQLCQCDNIYEVIRMLNKFYSSGEKSTRDEIGTLQNVLRRFEVNSLLKKLNEKLKQKIMDKNVEAQFQNRDYVYSGKFMSNKEK